MTAFSGFYESHGLTPSGDARGIVPAHRHGHRNGQQSGHILHYCFVFCHPGGRRGDTEWVVARWRRLVAFMKAPDLLHPAMLAVFHRHTAMAIEMASNIKSIKSLQRWPKNEHAQGPPPLRRHGFIKSKPLEERAAPTPWQCWLSCCLYFLCGFWLVTHQSYSSYVHFRGVTKWATHACTIPARARLLGQWSYVDHEEVSCTWQSSQYVFVTFLQKKIPSGFVKRIARMKIW